VFLLAWYEHSHRRTKPACQRRENLKLHHGGSKGKKQQGAQKKEGTTRNQKKVRKPTAALNRQKILGQKERQGV